MKIGIVGLPNVGKSTLFKALTHNPVDISNYPFCTIEPNVGVVRVPDERLEKLAEISKSKKTVPTVIEFVDIAGLVKGASKGEGLGNKFLASIREVDAIAQVVRAFNNPDIAHVYNKIDPKNDIEVVNMELILADLETTGKTKARLEKDLKGNKKGAKEQLAVVEKIKNVLEKGKLARAAEIYFDDENAKQIVREMSLLTMKPFIYVYNISEAGNKKLPACPLRQSYPPRLSPRLRLVEAGGEAGSEASRRGRETRNGNDNVVSLDIKIEEELGEMPEKETKELGIKSNLNQLVVKAYEILGLITFYTLLSNETRAWAVKKNSTAPEAGAVIHTDFQNKFIRADVINWEKLLEAGSWSKARELGWLRTEGKEYVIQDGDVIEFKI